MTTVIIIGLTLALIYVSILAQQVSSELKSIKNSIPLKFNGDVIRLIDSYKSLEKRLHEKSITK